LKHKVKIASIVESGTLRTWVLSKYTPPVADKKSGSAFKEIDVTRQRRPPEDKLCLPEFQRRNIRFRRTKFYKAPVPPEL